MKILRRALMLIELHARERLPFECCGVLLADRDEPETVRTILPAENSERVHPRHAYVLGHEAHITAVGLEATKRARIAGYFHSHPGGGPAPSRRDREDAVERVTYLIAGCRGERVECAAWRLRGTELVGEPLEVIEDEGRPRVS